MGRKHDAAVAVVLVAFLVVAFTVVEYITPTTGRPRGAGVPAASPLPAGVAKASTRRPSLAAERTTSPRLPSLQLEVKEPAERSGARWALSPSSMATATAPASPHVVITRVAVSHARVYCEDSESLTAVVMNSGNSVTADVEFTIHDAAGSQIYQTVLPAVRLSRRATTAQGLFPVIPCMDHGTYWLSVRVLAANGIVLATHEVKQADNQYVVLTRKTGPEPTETPLPPIPIAGTVTRPVNAATTRPSSTPVMTHASATSARLVFPFPLTKATVTPRPSATPATALALATTARLVFPFPMTAATPTIVTTSPSSPTAEVIAPPVHGYADDRGAHGRHRHRDPLASGAHGGDPALHRSFRQTAARPLARGRRSLVPGASPPFNA